VSTLSYEDCKVGMRVLLTHPLKSYSIGTNNPATNTKWECVGTIIEKSDHNIDVAWNNGHNNIYGPNELSLVKSGICIDIWQEIG